MSKEIRNRIFSNLSLVLHFITDVALGLTRVLLPKRRHRIFLNKPVRVYFK